MSLQTILDTYPQFVDNNLIDSNFVFKSCGINWIVVLEKLPDTQTNEGRDDIVDKQYAKHRADKLKVIMIFNKRNPKKTKDEISSSVYLLSNLIYKVNKIVYSDSFDPNVNFVCSHGIHYFLTIAPAYYYETQISSPDDIFMSWYDNGQKEQEGEYINDKKHGKYILWYRTGHKFVECEYVNGEYHGKYISWHENGQKWDEREYVNGKKHGKRKIK